MSNFEPSYASTPITCAQCKRVCHDGLYDDRRGQYYCDTACYNDWADGNFEEVVLFYAEMNVD